MKKKPELVMASYVTYRELYNNVNYKSPYQILGEFIKYIIEIKGLYSFSSVEMKRYIIEEFGFELPNAVIYSTLKKVECIEKLSARDEYSLKEVSIKVDSQLKSVKREAIKDNEILINKLIHFTENMECIKLDVKDKELLSALFMAYLLDESNGAKYQKSISAFILSCEKNPEDRRRVQEIREGCILYSGINYNIEETGSVTEPLELYLDVEILFNLIGYNGDMFQKLALEMIELIKSANKKKKNIHMKYFRETKREIDDFFLKAQDIVSGKVTLKENVAMKSITAGCNNISDIKDRQADFFYMLEKKYGIVLDSKKDYYAEDLYEANLEGIELGSENGNQVASEQSVKIISNINKLRKNELSTNYFKARYIFVTETWKTLDISKKIIEKMKNEDGVERTCCSYAINMSNITNLLWYKLNKGFGVNAFPQNINAVIKAKIVLSNFISQNINDVYDKCKDKYDKGEITDEQFAARLSGLKYKKVNPEDITIESIEEDLNFDPEHIVRFEKENEWRKNELIEKEGIIKELEQEKREIKKQLTDVKQNVNVNSKNIQMKDKKIVNQSRVIEKQKEKLEKYEEEESRRQKIKQNRMKYIKFGLHILGRVVLLVILVYATYIFTMQINADEATRVSIVVTVVGIVIGICDVVCRLYKKYFPNDNNTKQSVNSELS